MDRFSGQLLCAVLLAVAGPVSSQPEPIDGAAAPANCWYTRGGCAARTGISTTRPVRWQPAEIWRVTLRGELVGEPLTWNDIVLVEEKRGDHVA